MEWNVEWNMEYAQYTTKKDNYVTTPTFRDITYHPSSLNIICSFGEW